MIVHLIEWGTGILLGGFLVGYLWLRYFPVVKIDPSFPDKHLLHIVDSKSKKKWIVVNPATPWHMLEAIYLWFLHKNPKHEIEISNDRRVKILRRIWIGSASVVFFLGTICVSAEDFHLFKIQRPNQPLTNQKYYVANKEEPKQEKSALAQPISTQPDPKPQTSKSDQKTISKNEPDQNQEPELKQAAKENKPQSREVKQNHKELVYHKELDQRIHKINQNLQQIEEKLDSIQTKFPDSSSRDRSIELNRTIEEVKETLGEITKQMNDLQQQIPIVNELQLPRILR